jgi:chloramphenicol O-acetyltransferase type B
MAKRSEVGLKAWWRRHFGRQRTPRFYRGQEKFLKRYPNYEIGVGTYGLPTVHDWNEGAILRIGAYTSIADDVHIFLGGHHRTDWVASYPFPVFLDEAGGIPNYGGTRGDVCVGNDVWLASGCTILSGVTVGDGAVVAARAVVSRDVAPYSIVAGNPARYIRHRFDQAICQALLASAWWNWPESEVRQIVHLLCSNDLSRFLAYVEERKNQGSTGANR